MLIDDVHAACTVFWNSIPAMNLENARANTHEYSKYGYVGSPFMSISQFSLLKSNIESMHFNNA